MKSNTTHNAPITPIEDLGDGTFYYNFNVVHEVVTDEHGSQYDNYDYDQIRCEYPVSVENIQQKIDNENYVHTVQI